MISTEAPEMKSEALTILDQARAIRLEDAAGFEVAGNFLTQTLKPMLKKIEATFRPITRAQDAAKKETLAQRELLEAPILEAETKIKTAMAAFEMARAARLMEAEAQAAREAQEQADAELAAREAEAESLADRGQIDAACQLLDAPPDLVVPVPVAQELEQPKAAGVTVTKKWRHRVVDEARIPRMFLVVDDQKIAGLVRALGKAAESQCPGIVVEEIVVIGGRAR